MYTFTRSIYVFPLVCPNIPEIIKLYIYNVLDWNINFNKKVMTQIIINVEHIGSIFSFQLFLISKLKYYNVTNITRCMSHPPSSSITSVWTCSMVGALFFSWLERFALSGFRMNWFSRSGVSSYCRQLSTSNSRPLTTVNLINSFFESMITSVPPTGPSKFSSKDKSTASLSLMLA